MADQERAELSRRRALQGRHDVAVGVERQTDLAMAKDLHDNAGGRTLAQQIGGGAMPKVVKPLARQSGSLGELIEAMRHDTAVKRSSEGGREDETRICPPVPGARAFLNLPKAVVS